ncbi:UDP-N-acetylmuramate--L-alanine ligase [Pseudobdellovibrio exovorus]|uniref:UDP-N-acetylmuramate--L-alanine ligase n=1 Tax=Pseudobdellovibrio exovorus JSS TaxID=1184267 RepID=M4VAH2_9BACT|nr:UDP-N-acetylmuramate--L-alanine ligase [Pseudobdellovibrio exovorus]AGH96228.1 UDP-N-acetylmuramate--alanine ligase [Pseudobdellovibrio exovorus JSS]
MKLKNAKFHFIGIGGIGMCGLAELLHNIGATVTGSDASDNANTERLKALGIRVFKGHTAENVGSANVVVYSSAIAFSNPEMVQARAQDIPMIPRAEALAEIMRLRRGIAVAGTHGKTTTTSLISSIFLEAGQNPTIVIGGRFERIKSTAILGNGDWLIAEADESDGSFNKLSPEIAVITNIDSDHMDHFKSFENLKKAFLDFAYRIPFYGLVVVCGDDPDVRELFSNFSKRIVFYGFDPKNDYVIEGEKGTYTVYKNNHAAGTKERLGQFSLPHAPGRHNALNATASLVASMAAGVSFDMCAQGLQNFEGVDRRFHFKGEANQIKVYDDYGHHPTEVRAALQAFREKFEDHRLVVYFQPHRYSRTEHCWQDFKTCFSQADVLLMGDIYAAGEAPIPGISSEKLLVEVKHDHGFLSPKGPEQVAEILKQLKAGDIFLTLGAGDGWKLGLDVLEHLKQR